MSKMLEIKVRKRVESPIIEDEKEDYQHISFEGQTI